MKKTFHIYGMHCAGCVNSAEKALKKVVGVKIGKCSAYH
jgi:copper chaperone CopZ